MRGQRILVRNLLLHLRINDALSMHSLTQNSLSIDSLVDKGLATESTLLIGILILSSSLFLSFLGRHFECHLLVLKLLLIKEYFLVDLVLDHLHLLLSLSLTKYRLMLFTLGPELGVFDVWQQHS